MPGFMKAHASPFALAALLIAAPAEAHEFHLSGGFFFGPGPIVPDTALPDGTIRDVAFDVEVLRGHAPFSAHEEKLSDGKTRVNANIDAGVLSIGEQTGDRTFWLVAVDGGPNGGEESYEFDEDMNMIWTVDLALDPGFSEGIVRVDDFQLTSGWVRIPPSAQTERSIPGGYDKAGTLASGDVLMGRVGDFDFDGMLDGIVVASPRVPMLSELLPGAPVGNLRGFTSDIPIDPLLGAELVLHGVLNMRPLIDEAIEAGDQPAMLRYVTEARSRVIAAQRNFEDKFLAERPERRKDLREMGWRLESVSQLVFVAWAFLTDYTYPPGRMSASVVDATTRALDKMAGLATLMAEYRTGPEG